MGQRESASVVLAHVAARRPVGQLDADLDAARNDRHLAGCDVDDAELGPQPQRPRLRHEEQLAVGVVEVLVHHRTRHEVDVRAHPGLRAGITGGRDRAHAVDERHRLLGQRHRAPAHRRDRHLHLVARRGAPQADIGLVEVAEVRHRRADAIEPGALVGGARRRERRAAELLGVEPVGALLRRVAADRQRSRQRFGLEAVAKPRHVVRGLSLFWPGGDLWRFLRHVVCSSSAGRST
jgi:hypothetical protein